MPKNGRSDPATHNSSPKSIPILPDPDTVAGKEGVGSQNAQRRRKAATNNTVPSRETDEAFAEEIAFGYSPPARTSSIVKQLPYSFGRNEHRHASPLPEAFDDTEKVSNREALETPNAWSQSPPLGVSPPIAAFREQHISRSSSYTQEIRGGFSTRSPPVSPPQRNVRPVSYGSGMNHRQPGPEMAHRYSVSAFGSSPPPPHMPQAHFFGAPDIDLGFPNSLHDRMADRTATYLGLCQLPAAKSATTALEERVLLIGSDSRLDVLLVDKTELKPLGTIQGIGGRVCEAVIMPQDNPQGLLRDLRPLVVLVVHGLEKEAHQARPGSEQGYEDHDHIAVPQSVPGGNQQCYQTCVEVYSLAKQNLVATLLKTQPTASQAMPRGFQTSPPSPAGNLRLDVSGHFITVSSGISGEIFVFNMTTTDGSLSFRCLTKLWTSIQARENRRSSSTSAYSDRDVSPADLAKPVQGSDQPILALSGRFLAFCPPDPVSRSTISAQVPPEVALMKEAGTAAYNAPPRPSTTCVIDSPDAPSLLNRMARGLAQEVVKGAKWLGDQGMQTWHNYWNRDQDRPASQTSPYSQPFYPPEQPAMFPPTHAEGTSPGFGELELVSIVDLKRLQTEQTPSKADVLASASTFQPPGGCSFLSFAPGGLNLLTASRKGDVQYVWDLMQIKVCRAATFMAAGTDSAQSEAARISPRVRQVAHFARLTTSTVVDVVWSDLVGDRFALTTRNGTVHVLDLPQSAFQWPPLRRAIPQASASIPSNSVVQPQQDEATPNGILANAWKVAGKTQPYLATLKGRAPSLGSGTSSPASSALGYASITGYRSSRAVAAGLGQVASGTVNTIRRAGENRLHLPDLARDPARSRVQWSIANGEAVLIAASSRSISFYRVKRPLQPGSRRQRSHSVVEPKALAMLKIPEPVRLRPVSGGMIQINDPNQSAVTGFWSSQPPSKSEAIPKAPHPLSHAEIETNAPYQPFHSDRRVTLNVYTTEQQLSESQLPTASALFEPVHTVSPTTTDRWVFGNDIRTTKLHIRSSSQIFHDSSDDVPGIVQETINPGEGEEEFEFLEHAEDRV